MSEPITIIGSETVVSGNLEGDEDLTIEGRVEGSISLSKTLCVEVGGVVRADINVRNAIISGVLVGNVEAQESVHVTEQGRVVGDISAPRVILVDGASFKGNIDMGNFDVDRISSTETASTRVAAPAPARSRAATPREEEVVEEVVETPAPRRVTPVRKPEPVQSSRPLPAKTKVIKTAPVPKARAISKKKKATKK
ncbi:MAG: polymer-forming cytoskeletal protein [Deltaproteobacteria bacterium]|nr:polymer-forming cytoskeletal protein [Deltaproteobacteria bacterium]